MVGSCRASVNGPSHQLKNLQYGGGHDMAARPHRLFGEPGGFCYEALLYHIMIVLSKSMYVCTSFD